MEIINSYTRDTDIKNSDVFIGTKFSNDDGPLLTCAFIWPQLKLPIVIVSLKQHWHFPTRLSWKKLIHKALRTHFGIDSLLNICCSFGCYVSDDDSSLLLWHV